MSLPVIGHHDALEVGVLLETDAEQIKDFALEEVSPWPDRGEGIHPRVVAGETDFQPKALLGNRREQVINDSEARIRRLPINAGEVGEGVEVEFRIVLERRTGFAQKSTLDIDRQLISVELDALHRACIPSEQTGQVGPVFQLFK